MKIQFYELDKQQRKEVIAELLTILANHRCEECNGSGLTSHTPGIHVCGCIDREYNSLYKDKI